MGSVDEDRIWGPRTGGQIIETPIIEYLYDYKQCRANLKPGKGFCSLFGDGIIVYM